MPATPDAFDQSTYQVRLEWGIEGLARLAPADVIVVVDVLRFSTTVIRALEDGIESRLDDARATSINGAVVAAAAAGTGVVLLGALRNASAVAAAARRFGPRVSVIPAGERWPDGSMRAALEDWLGAGAILARQPAHPLDPFGRPTFARRSLPPLSRKRLRLHQEGAQP